MTTYEDLPYQELSLDVWRDKYRFGDEASPADTLTRVANAVSPGDTGLLDALLTHKFVPGGRILAGLGTTRKVTFSQCYVIPSPEDSMEGILHTLGEYALTLKAGGGVGFNISTLRPKGTEISTNPGAVSSGPMSFANIFDAASKTIVAGGGRRGASMLVMDVSHPDIEEFITAKQTAGVLTQFNISVAISDAFMRAVETDKPWDLVFNGVVVKTVSAKALWNSLMRATYETAEPGVLFIDQINQTDPLGGIDVINATNPCVAAGTLVLTKNGYMPVEQVVAGTKIKTATQGFLPVTRVERHENIPVFRVGFTDGTTLRVTAAHIFHSRGPAQQNRKWNTDTRLDQLAEGAYVRTAVTNVANEILALGSTEDYLRGRLNGLLLGNGCLTAKPIKLTVGHHQEGMLTRIMADNPEWFGQTPYKDKTVFAIALRVAAPVDIPTGCLSHEKHIPIELINNSTQMYLQGLIDGYVSTDGNVNLNPSNPQIRIASTSKELLLGAKRILNLFGVRCSVYATKKEPTTIIKGRVVHYRHQAYTLVILGAAIKDFASNFSLVNRDKQAKLDDLANHWLLSGDTQTTRISAIVPDGTADVYDLYESTTDTWITEGIVSTGCGEQTLPPYASCNLGAINLVPFVPFGVDDLHSLRDVAAGAASFLDSVLDVNYYPLEAQRQRAMYDRRIGLGIMGLGSALAIMDIPYGSPEALTVLEAVLSSIMIGAQSATLNLASSEGPCRAYLDCKIDYPKQRLAFFNNTTLLNAVAQHFKEQIEKCGVRNSHLFTIAPTGNTSIFAKNVSGGLEPVFAPRHNRAVLQPDGTKRTYEVVDASLALGASEKYFETNKATALSVDAHLAMLATAQKFIDNSVSKTINVAADCDFESFKEVYTKAYSLGCKGCTTYRPSEIRGAVLTETKATAAAPTTRPRVLSGKTYKIRWDGSAYYVTINDLEPGRPFEFFINSKNKEDLAWVTALTRLASAILRKDGNPELLITEFKEVFGVGGEWEQGTFYSTIINKLGAVLEEHMGVKVEIPAYSKCPKCGSHEIVHSEGCISCTACGYSKCS